MEQTKKYELINACIKGDITTVQRFLDHEYGPFDIDSILNINKWTALYIAVFYGHESIVRLLIERKSNINVINTYNSIPLHYAACKGYESIVLLLIDHQADVNIKGINFVWKEYKTPIEVAQTPELHQLMIDRVEYHRNGWKVNNHHQSPVDIQIIIETMMKIRTIPDHQPSSILWLIPNELMFGVVGPELTPILAGLIVELLMLLAVAKPQPRPVPA